MKTNKPLPQWLNDYIFGVIGAEEKPDPKEFCKNLDSDDEKNKIYLGTYFPRSFAESFCIHSNLFSFEPYRTHLEKKEELSLLSIGCGTGGDILGLICAIANNLPNISKLKVVAFDGNNIAIDYLSDLLGLEPIKSRFGISDKDIKYVPLPVTCVEDLVHYIEHMGDSFDLITSFKFVNELMDARILKQDGFRVLAELLAPKLNDTGLLTLLDVTDKHFDVWQSKNFNSGLCAFSKANADFKTLLPTPCHFYDRNCIGGRCFTNKRFFGTFTADDKVVYRVIGKSEFVDALYTNLRDGVSYIKNVDNEYCPGYRGRTVVDAFDINS